MTRLHSLFIIAFMAFSTISAEAAKPKWVKKRPSEREYYIGIGMAQKDKNAGLDYAKKARTDALKEMASEIEVNVSSNSLLRQFEDNYEFQTWENKREYWVLMRLNKDRYQLRKQQDLEMAKQKAALYLFDARKQTKALEITAALASYFKAIESLEHHLQEDLSYRSIDGNINFGIDIMQALRQLFSQISITPVNPEYEVSFSKNMETPLQAKIEFFSQDGKNVLLRNFPVKFKFTEGAGILQEQVTSNPDGDVVSYIQKLESSRKKQQVSVSFDHTVLLQKENIESPLVSFFLPKETIPEAVFNIEIQKSKAWFSANEYIFGTTISRQPFASLLKSQLNETFFNFTHSPKDAAYIVEINVDFKKGDVKDGTGYSVYLVFADLYISISSAKTKTEIFNDAITGIKGMRPGSYDYAITEARQKLLEQFQEEIYPQLEAINF
jgi:hypothetical protein